MKISLKTILKYFLLLFYPLFISVLLEYNICQNFNDTLNFLISKPNILIFNILLFGIFFAIILLIVKKSYIAMILHGGIFYILSTVEYFKYKTSGSHLVISDLIMTKNLSDVGKFASLEITYPLVLNLIILAIYIYLAYKFNIILEYSLKQRIFSSSFATAVLVLMLTTSISSIIFSAFEIETTVATNILESNEQFSDIGFLPYLTKTTTENLMDSIEAPENYSAESIDSILNEHKLTKADSSYNFDKKPNVIFIMSESFSDFRVFDSLDLDEEIYKDFDAVGSEGYVGNCVVPTFGGYTTRTEFELLLGLPTYAINTPSIPQNNLKKQENKEAFPSYFKSLGYSTNYIHPFSKSFYNRSNLYSEYGFDNLYFDDNMTVDVENFRRYTSDSTVFNQIKEILTSQSKPSYIFTTTMQNHQPYYDEAPEGADQLEYYLEGVQETGRALREFTNWLKDYDEDVMLVFLGDHFPFFTPDDNVYDRLGVSDANAQLIYNQKYLIWNNYDSEICTEDLDTISAFYIPYIISDLINAPDTTQTKLMKDLMEETPVYSPSKQSNNTRNSILDLITYDKVIGENYSFQWENNEIGPFGPFPEEQEEVLAN